MKFDDQLLQPWFFPKHIFSETLLTTPLSSLLRWSFFSDISWFTEINQYKSCFSLKPQECYTNTKTARLGVWWGRARGGTWRGSSPSLAISPPMISILWHGSTTSSKPHGGDRIFTTRGREVSKSSTDRVQTWWVSGETELLNLVSTKGGATKMLQQMDRCSTS